MANGRVARRAVTLGQQRGDLREVANGTSAGEVVVLNPPAGLRDGAEVAVEPGE